jgi:hypothetical protein
MVQHWQRKFLKNGNNSLLKKCYLIKSFHNKPELNIKEKWMNLKAKTLRFLIVLKR